MSLIRPFRVISLGILVWTMIEAACIRSGLTRQLLPSSVPAGSGRLYIASIHWNNGAILRSNCMPAVLDLVRKLRTQQVHIRIQESGG